MAGPVTWRRLTASVAFGIAATLGISAVAAVSGFPSATQVGRTDSPGLYWTAFEGRRWNAQVNVARGFVGDVGFINHASPVPDAFSVWPAWAPHLASFADRPSRSYIRIVAFAVGWPARSFAGYADAWRPEPDTDAEWDAPLVFNLHSAVGIGNAPASAEEFQQFVPTSILPSGLAINVASFAAVPMGLFVLRDGVRGILARFRKRRSLCGSCCYPVATGSVCPECGSGRT